MGEPSPHKSRPLRLGNERKKEGSLDKYPELNVDDYKNRHRAELAKFKEYLDNAADKFCIYLEALRKNGYIPESSEDLEHHRASKVLDGAYSRFWRKSRRILESAEKSVGRETSIFGC